MSKVIHVGVFDRERDLLDAVRDARPRGLRNVVVDSPLPIHAIDELIGIRRSRLPIVCFIGGSIGLCLGLGFQYWSSAVDWPLNVGGKPFDSLPAFIPVGFELTVLFAGLATAFMLLMRSRLWPGRRAAVVPGVTDDRFALSVARTNAELPSSEIPTMLKRHGALEVIEELES